MVGGIRLVSLPLPSGTYLSFDEAQGTLLTIVLAVAAANAVNFVDGLDLLAAGVVGIGAAAFFSYAYLLAVEGNFRLTTPALVTAVLCGMCLGFLPPTSTRPGSSWATRARC